MILPPIAPPISPLTADLNCAGYKTIAMACDNGTSFPTPASNRPQWFYRTDIYTLFIYEGAWKAIISFGAVSLYVDPTNGLDAVGKGYASGSGATATRQYAIDLIPPLNGGNVTVNLAAGTYIDAASIIKGKAFSGAYTITFVGAMTTQDTGTATSGAAYTGGASAHTKATLTNTAKAYTVNAHVNRLLVITGGTGVGQERFIYSNTATILTIVGDWDTVPDATSTYAIKIFDTIIDCNDTRSYAFKQENQKGIVYKYIKVLNANAQGYYLITSSEGEIQSCFIEDTTTAGGQGIMATIDSAISVKTVAIKYTNRSGTGIVISAKSSAIAPKGIENVWIYNTFFGIYLDGLNLAEVKFSLIESTGYGIYVNQNSICKIQGYSGAAANTVITGSTGNGIYVSVRSFAYNYAGLEVNGSTSHGVVIDTQSLYWRIGTMRISNNGGWGVSTSEKSLGKTVSGATYSGNTSGTYTADATSLNT